MRCWAATSISSSVGATGFGASGSSTPAIAAAASSTFSAARASPAADGDEVLARVVRQLTLPPKPRSSASARSTIEPTCSSRQRLQPEHAQARQQRRVDLEIGVLGGRADQRDRAVLDLRQQRVLLRLVEAVDLVEEQHRRPAALVDPLARRGDHGAHVGDAAHDRD